MSNQSSFQGSQKAQANQQNIIFTPPIKQPLQQITQKGDCISTPSTGKKFPRSADYYNTPTRSTKSPNTTSSTVVNLSLRPGIEQDKLLKSLQEQIYQAELNIKQLQKQNQSLLNQSGQSIADQINQQPVIVDQAIEINNNENILKQYKQIVTDQVNHCKEILLNIKQYEQQNTNFDDNIDLEIDKLNKGILQQKMLQDQFTQHLSAIEQQLQDQDTFLQDIRQQLQLSSNDTFEHQLMQQKIKLNNYLNEQRTYMEKLEQQTNEIKEKQEYINQLIDSTEYKQYLELQEEYEKQLNEQQKIFELSHYNNKLETHIDTDLRQQIYDQEVANEQLIQRMIEYGDNEGFTANMEQLTFQDYLQELSEFIREKYRMHNEKFKRLYAELNNYSAGEEANEPESYFDYVDLKYNVNSAPETYNFNDDLYQDIYDENLYTVYRDSAEDGQYTYNVDVSKLTTQQIEYLLKQLEDSSISQNDVYYIVQQKQKQKPKKVIDISADEEIEQHSEHDTIDDEDDSYRRDFRYSLNDYDFQ